MKKVFESRTSSEVFLLKGLLEENGIACVIKNENLPNVFGVIPFVECNPELWIVDEQDMAFATELIESWRGEENRILDSWICESCGEKIEGQFSSCWNCGKSRKDQD